jgi:glycosyltransferase involved in cell wall biosynthesis
LTALGVKHVKLVINNTGINPVRELAAIARITSVLRTLRPTLILTHTPKVNIYLSIAARMVGIPVIANVSGLGRIFTKGGLLELVTRQLYRLALQHPDVVYFQNEEDRIQFIEAGLVDSVKAERLPGSGVNVIKFRPRTLKDRDSRFVFLLSARLLWDKGIREFIEAARRVKIVAPSTRFCIVGFVGVDNPSAVSPNEVERWKNEGVVEYLGATDDIETTYANSDCVVLPSFYREGVPRSLLEAASMGLPVITSDTPGCRDVVDDGLTGLLCKPKDVDSLVYCMLRVLRLTESQRREMGEAARRKMINHFNEEIVIDRYLASIERLTSERGAKLYGKR